MNDHQGAVRALLVYGRRAARLLAVPAGLFLVAFLLRSVAFFDRLAQQESALQITVEQQAGSSFLVRGKVPTGSVLEVGTGSRVLDRPFPEPNGAFTASIQADVWAQQVWVRALRPGSLDSLRREAPLRWRDDSMAPILDLCVYLESPQMLWLAGRATPYDSFEVRGVPGVTARPTISADRFGVVDTLIPAADPVLADIHLSDARDARTPPITCSRTTSADRAPLVRTGTVNQPSMIDLVSSLSTSARLSPMVADVVKVMLPTVTFSITVPTMHPYFQAFASGGISATDFLSSTFGDLDGVLTADVVPMLKAQFAASQTGGPSAEDLNPRSQVRINGGLATVDLTLRAFAAEITGRLSFAASSDNGIAGHPLLTEHDVLTIKTDSGWHYETLPSELDEGRAVWRGPSAVREVVVTPPRSMLELFQTLERVTTGRNESEPETIRAFLEGFEVARQTSFMSRLWRVALLLLPCASVWWILRAGVVLSPGRGQLSALTLFLALVMSWPFMSDQLLYLIQPLTGAAILVFQAVSFDVTSQPDQLPLLIEIGSVPKAAAWIVFVTIVGLAPLYFGTLSTSLSESANAHGEVLPPRRPFHWVARMVLGLAIVALGTWALIRLQSGYVEQFLTYLSNYSTWRGIVSMRSEVPESTLFAALVASLLGALPTIVFGLRGMLFGTAYVIASGYIILFADTAGYSVVLGLLALCAVPLVFWLFGLLLPVRGRLRGLIAIGFVVICASAQRASEQMGLTLSAGMLGLGFMWVVTVGLGRTRPAARLGQWLDEYPLVAAALCVVAGVAIGWPLVAPGGTLEASNVAALADHWNKLFGPVLGVVLAFMLWEHAETSGSQVLDGRALRAGMILYAVFLVGPTTTWLLLPIPLIVAVVLAGWVFKDEKERMALPTLHMPSDSSRVAAYVKRHSLRTGIEGAIASLHDQFQKGKVTPEKFEQRLAAYQEFGAKASTDTSTAPERLFAVGMSDLPHNIVAFIAIGLLLASVPLVVSLYQYLPVSRVDYPFPIAGFVVFVVLATLKWGLFAAFFGLLYPNLRGDTGLTKGLCFFLALAVPSAIPYVLGAAGLDSVRPFALWLAQLFVFCSLLGLFASDVRLLRSSGLNIRDLRAVHRMPVLSAFASTIAAAVVPTILSIAAGQADEVVKVFIQLVSPSGPTTP